MMNKYITEWQTAIEKASKALNESDINAYEKAMYEANSAFNDFKRDKELTYECKNFGMANYIFEDALPSLFKAKSKAVKEFVETIKEDKNLHTEFNFFKALEKYNKEMNSNEFINETLELVYNNINPKTLNESNSKLYAIISKYNIKPSDNIPSDKLALYENCNYVFSHKKNLSNLVDYNNSVKSIAKFTEDNYNALNENINNPLSLIETFEKNYASLLNEEEMSLVQEITDWRSESAENNKQKLFDKFKNECLVAVDKLLGEANDTDKDNLIAIKEQITNKIYCKETVVKDLAKLLEIRDVLNS